MDIDHVQRLRKLLSGSAVFEHDADLARLRHIANEVHQGQRRAAVLVGAQAETFVFALLRVKEAREEQKEDG